VLMESLLLAKKKEFTSRQLSEKKDVQQSDTKTVYCFFCHQRHCKQDSRLGERIVTTHMLVLMVQGIYFKMDVPIAQFPTTGLHTTVHYNKLTTSEFMNYAGMSADDLVWKATWLLSLSGLQVCGVLYIELYTLAIVRIGVYLL